MRREELAHLLRAAARIADDEEILVIGSQAILGSYWEDDLPEEAWLSVEADVAFLDDPDATKADLVDGAIGELSEFHQTNSYYAQGVEVRTAILPDGWRDRLVHFSEQSAEPPTAVCLEPHDLVISKLAAHREKDFAFASSLLAAGLVNPSTARASRTPAQRARHHEERGHSLDRIGRAQTPAIRRLKTSTKDQSTTPQSQDIQSTSSRAPPRRTAGQRVLSGAISLYYNI